MTSTSPFLFLTQKRMWVALMMGFSSGLPYLLTLRTLQTWMTQEGVSLKTVGIFAMVGLPYTLKFVWAPFMDRFNPFGIGRRRGWMMISQIGILGCLVAMALTNPKDQTWLMALWALLVSFFSASQDTVVDAYRRESLLDNELGLGSTLYVYGYRIAMWVSGGLALILAHQFGWQPIYFLMAAIMGIAMIVTLFTDEPKVESQPTTLRQAVTEPFLEFMKRRGAVLVLLFILFYKAGDVIAGNMLSPFYLKMGYSLAEIGWIAKTLSLPAVLLGGLVGGLLVQRLGIIRCLFIFGFFQAASTSFFSLLTQVDHNLWLLGAVILFEDISGSLGTTAFIAFMGSMTNKQFTATQYALLSSLTKVPQVFLSSYAGFMVDALGWTPFFVTCSLVAIPGIIMIYWMSRLQKSQPDFSLAKT